MRIYLYFGEILILGHGVPNIQRFIYKHKREIEIHRNLTFVILIRIRGFKI